MAAFDERQYLASEKTSSEGGEDSSAEVVVAVERPKASECGSAGVNSLICGIDNIRIFTLGPLAMEHTAR